jgi:predicted Fe-Mo cluster-binding NifX family protein
MIMGKIGCTVLINRDDSPLSSHFGKAKWVMIADPETGAAEFEQNHGLNGRAVVEILARHGCSDAIFAEIGPGALSHLQQAQIKPWFGPQDLAAPAVIDRLKRGQLTPAHEPSTGHGQHHAGSSDTHGCCGSSAAHTSCCGEPKAQ